MSTHIETNVLCKLNDDFLKNIEIISVFGHKVSEVLIVTKDDKVFGFGQNGSGVLGFGHKRQVNEPKIVKELCGKEVISFVNGLDHVIGLTKDGKIYSWGKNEWSQLGNGTRNNKFNKPEINKYLINEVIIDVSCGAYHSLVLTVKNELFVWGYNNYGQIGNENEELFQLTPFKLNAFNSEKLIAISCGFSDSLALTENGYAFSWGSRVLKINKPKLIEVRNNKSVAFIQKICCGPVHSMLLSNDGDIYSFDYNRFGQIGNNSKATQMTQKINSLVKYKDIASHFLYNISIALSVNNIYYIWGKFGKEVKTTPKETQFKTINNIFLNYNQITYKSIRISIDFELIMNSCLDDKQNDISENTKQDFIQTKDHLNDFSLLFSPNVIAKYRKKTKIEINTDEGVLISFHFFDYDNESPYNILGRNALFVTEDSKVYAIGSNNNGLIGFGNKKEINEKIIINELCCKGIIDFANGVNHVMARTDENKVYIWGYNRFGQLGNQTNEDCFVPQLIHILIDEGIVDISCGSWHSLTLTASGEVYAWGNNRYGQIGNKGNYDQLTPFKIQTFDEQKIIAISCGSFHSLALTESGRVYSWGRNDCGQLGFREIVSSNVPKFIQIKNNNKTNLSFERISCGPNYSLLLTSDGDIYGFGSNEFGQLGNQRFENHFIPTKVMSKNKFNEIASHYDCNISVALSINGIYYIWGLCGQPIITEPKATNIHSLNNIFLNYYKITYNDNKLKNNFRIEIKENGEYSDKFVENEVIGYGGFGIVSKAKNNNENEFFAIKRIGIKDKFNYSLIREIKMMSKLKSDYIVELKSAWIEDNYLLNNGFKMFENSNSKIKNDHLIFKTENLYLLHIQMELCFKTLSQIIEQINNELNQKISQNITPIGYYIASELLYEILESVNYLHKQKPPVIHRDLKPSNFLIVNGINGRFVKLTDFGLAKFHELESQSHTKGVGTPKYMAPEIMRSEKYNTKADVFSIGMIIPELFNLDFDELPVINIVRSLRNKSQYLTKIMYRMMATKKTDRPNCKQVLKKKNDWSLSLDLLENDNKFIELCNQPLDNESYKTNFCSAFVQKKFEIFQLNKRPTIYERILSLIN